MDFIQTILTKIGALEMKDWTIIVTFITSIVSLLTSFFHPEIRKWFRKRFFQTKINFISIDNLILFYNRSGSFVRLNITFQPINDAITIKNISVRIQSEKSKECRILNWSSFLPLVVQNFGTMQLNSFAEAAPARILQDDIKTFKLEFADTDNERNNNLLRWQQGVIAQVNSLDLNTDIKQLKEQLLQSPQIISWKNELSEDFFWKEGKFSMEVLLTDSLNIQYKTSLLFYINSEESKQFRKNIEEFFFCEIEQRKNILMNFFTANKNFATKTLEYKKP